MDGTALQKAADEVKTCVIVIYTSAYVNNIEQSHSTCQGAGDALVLVQFLQ